MLADKNNFSIKSAFSTLQLILIKKDKQVGKETSSLNGRILEPGIVTNPISMIWPAFVFLFGPFPFIGDPGIAIFISSLESPLWWIFYGFIAFTLFKLRTAKLFQDPLILFSTVFILGLIACSAIIEVNLGTSFRHRSILLAPLLFLYVRANEKFKEFKI